MLKYAYKTYIFIFTSICLVFSNIAFSQYSHPQHRAPGNDEEVISRPGSYGMPGTTYLLTNDISSARSTLFLGKDVVLDLNGYTVSFADTSYAHVPNSGFEEGLKGWDVSKAPDAKIEDTKVHVFIGDKILRLSKGDEIVSQYIRLPLGNRSYLAMCGVIGPEMKVSVYVEDETGRSVICKTRYRDGLKQSCPVEDRSPRLGGGFVFAHLNRLPAGKYRIRVKAETDCLIDQVDIRPAMDVGIGIVEKTDPMGDNDHLYERAHSAFFDYTADALTSEPVAGIPRVTGKGTVIIKNGIIKNGSIGALSWGIQSTANNVRIILDNVKVINSGINATAVDVPQATITHSTFDVTNPFIINRHGSEFYAVDLRGDLPSEVSYSDFYGGQGCLVFKGNQSVVHHNHFVNRQTVTNHYSIMAMGDSSSIYANDIEPEIGSGIEVYVHRGMEIFNNTIRIQASPPTCEYGHEEYSVDAIRIADYNAEPGSPAGSSGNKVYNNKIYVTGKDYPEYSDYIPMAWAVFYSSSAGDNFIFGNDIYIEDLSPGKKNETSAFYIGGGTIGGKFYDNRITTNVPAAWVACRYGGDMDTELSNNTIIKSPHAEGDFQPFRMGWAERKDCVAKNIEFRSNKLVGLDFGIDATAQPHSYSVWWTLTVNVEDKKENPAKNTVVQILDTNGKQVVRQSTDEGGMVKVELQEYSVDDQQRTVLAPYTVVVGKVRQKVSLKKDDKITVKIKA